MKSTNKVSQFPSLSMSGKSNLLVYAMIAAGAIMLAVWICFSSAYLSTSSSKKAQISAADFMFDLTATSKQFENDDSLVNKYNIADHGSVKEIARMASKIFQDELVEQKYSYPLTRLVVAKSLFGEKIHEFKRHSENAVAADASLAKRIRDELENATEPSYPMTSKELETALPNDLMRLYFLSKAKHQTAAESLQARKVLTNKLTALHSMQIGLAYFDFVLAVVAVAFCVYLALTKFHLLRPVSNESVAYAQELNFSSVVFATILASISDGLFSMFAEMILQYFVTQPVAHCISRLLSYPFGIYVLYELSIRQLNLPFAEGFRLRWSDFSGNARMLVVGLGAFLVLVLLSIAMTITSVYLPSEITDESLFVRVFNAINNSTLLILILQINLLGPIAEELCFRGFMFSALRAKWGFLISACLSAAVFTAAHLQFNPYTALHHFLFGLLAAYLLEKTKSVIPAIVMHSIWNFSVTNLVVLNLLAIYPTSKIFF